MPRRRTRQTDTQPRGKQKVRILNRLQAEARENLERKWYSRIDFAHALAPLTIHTTAQTEAMHRWLPYRQGFSPELVRKYLRDGEVQPGVILDPFSGSGVTVIESAKQGFTVFGIEAIASLAFLTQVRLEVNSIATHPEAEILPAFGDEINTLEEAIACSPTNLHRAAVLMAAARTVKGDGKPRKDLPPVKEMLAESLEIIREDLEEPLPGKGYISQGDARVLPLANNSVGGILTSPPYLSRYDYTRVTRPVEDLYNLIPYQGDVQTRMLKNRKQQVRAHSRAHKQRWSSPPHPAVKEACSLMRENNKRKEAGITQSYFEDMKRVLIESTRVLKPGAPMTMVIAGAIFGNVYIPSELVVAEFCEECGLKVEEILLVRNFSRTKRLGNIESVAPREVILSARKD